MTAKSGHDVQLEPKKSVSIPGNTTFLVTNDSDQSGSCLVDDNLLFTPCTIAPHASVRLDMSMGGKVTNTGPVALTVTWPEPRG
jgi:hypothetical protein